MNKWLIGILLPLAHPSSLDAQQQYLDSLRHSIEIEKNDTAKIALYTTIVEAYKETRPDSCVYFAEQLLGLSKKLNFKLNEANAKAQMGYAYLNLGNYPRSLQLLLPALATAGDPASEQHVLPGQYIEENEFLTHPVTPLMLRQRVLARVHLYTGILYSNTNDTVKEFYHYHYSLRLAKEAGHIIGLVTTYITLGRLYLSLQKTDSALMCEQRAYDLSIQKGFVKYLGSILLNLGRIQTALGNKPLATAYYRRGINESIEQNYLRGVVAGKLLLAELYKQEGQKDSTFYYARKALAVAQDLRSPDLLLRCYTALAGYFRSTPNKDSIVKYQELIIRMNDSLFNSKQAQQFKNIDFDETQRQQQMDAAQSAYRYKARITLLLAGLIGFLIVALVLWTANRQRQKANALLSSQKTELQSTLTTLRTTQIQLIQSEKMASLGELTAGIAHEIENPLNFVKNFSEVNKELIAEMKLEIGKGNLEEVNVFAANLEENEEKIIHHVNRADAIVKGMLAHSRSARGNPEPTDLNTLAAEYLQLSYRGMRAKDQTLYATMETHFDENIGKITLIRGDLGHVLLSLCNNAFYVVSEKKKIQPEGYQPIVSMSTRKLDGKVEIKVKDNGIGIPQKVIDKIFQPFFTTKPTGQGIGLGLSLSYQIIKANGGTLTVSSEEGEGAEFVILLTYNEV